MYLNPKNPLFFPLKKFLKNVAKSEKNGRFFGNMTPKPLFFRIFVALICKAISFTYVPYFSLFRIFVAEKNILYTICNISFIYNKIIGKSSENPPFFVGKFIEKIFRIFVHWKKVSFRIFVFWNTIINVKKCYNFDVYSTIFLLSDFCTHSLG